MEKLDLLPSVFVLHDSSVLPEHAEIEPVGDEGQHDEGRLPTRGTGPLEYTFACTMQVRPALLVAGGSCLGSSLARERSLASKHAANALPRRSQGGWACYNCAVDKTEGRVLKSPKSSIWISPNPSSPAVFFFPRALSAFERAWQTACRNTTQLSHHHRCNDSGVYNLRIPSLENLAG